MSDWHQREHSPNPEEKVVQAVRVLADIVETNGPAFRPLHQDVRQQLADLRLQQAEASAKARAAHDNTKVA